MPKGEAGDTLTFKALQTYEDGDVVRWIGPEDADEPAPVVTLTDASSGGGHGAPGRSPTPPCRPTTAPRARPSRPRTLGHRRGRRRLRRLAIAALAVAVVALAPAGASLVRRTR